MIKSTSSMDALWFITCFIYVFCSLLKVSALNDSITASQSLRDGETLVSSGGNFALGFFSPGVSKNRYLGIWYKNIPIQTVVWVANRANPISDSSGSLKFTNSSSVALENGNNSVVWSTNSIRAPQDPVLQLLDSGNLVLRDGNADTYLWQSFDYPGDTMLPGMKYGWDLRTSLDRRFTAWKSPDDPSPGELSMVIELGTYPQGFLLKGTRRFVRGGPWNGLRFSGTPELRANPVFDFKFVWNKDEVYYTFELLDKSVISMLVMNETTSSRQRHVWVESSQEWRVYNNVPVDQCDNYALCGANGMCIVSDSPICQCLEGFKPKSATSWNAMDWSQGCIRTEPLDCNSKPDFIKYSGLKVPDTTTSWVNRSMNIRECREMCLKNCSCIAFTNSNISGQGSGCALWFGDLMDIRQFPDGAQDLYIRMPASSQAKRPFIIAAAVIVPVAAICSLFFIIRYLRRRRRKAKGEMDGGGGGGEEEEDETALAVATHEEDLDLPLLLGFDAVVQATDNFSINKKLGEGGFGPVYKGLLMDGQSIAVKRLSENSGQGLTEFKNEVKLIAKLQHRNLVKLLGCCMDNDEKILIYEYMPNGSLDSILFDTTRGSQLDWPKRFNIICGVARGLLYLHQDSRLRIIHRDLKASNILLDDDLNPKISDFGLARSFVGDQREDNTRRIVGTYGYMAPEYALYGKFSVKSDVFSFGTLMLEIVSGNRNKWSDSKPGASNLIEYVWKMWIEGETLGIIDPLLDNHEIQPETFRCIHVGLLCIQQNPENRPSMSTVVLMLNGDSVLPQPKQPGILKDLVLSETYSSSSKNELFSVNDTSITALQGR